MQEENNQELPPEEKSDETKALEKFEKERQNILNSAVSGKIRNTKDRVAFILNNFVSARNSDIELSWLYWENFERHLFEGDTINKEEMFRLTKVTSLTRIRAKLQNEYKLFQANDRVRSYRRGLAEEKMQVAVEDKPSYPLYKIYIDETGKTQKYLSVGSLWITDSKSAFFAFLKLLDWKKERKIDFEFHFAELKNHRLELFKAFVLKFLSLHSSIGFKVIIVDRSGFKNINNAITDLTFHLINKGIEHEHETGRATLPRLLQVEIDNEEKGSDKLKLENIKERIVSQKIEGLSINSFEAVDSSKSIYLQMIDLFYST